MLELRGKATVCRDNCPPVIERPHFGRAEVDHRLYGQDHPGPKPQTGTASADVRDVRLHVHLPTDTVTAVVPNDAAPEAPRKFGNSSTDVAKASPVPDDRDPCVSASTSNVHDVSGLISGVPDDERRRGVPVEPAQAGCDIDVDDVPRPQQFIRSRDAMAYDVVAARADGGGEALASG